MQNIRGTRYMKLTLASVVWVEFSFFFLGCQLVLNRRRYSLCLSTQQYLHFANLGHRIPIQSITGMTIQLNRVWSARVYFSSMMLTQNSLSGIIPHLQWSSWVMVSRQKYFFCRSFNYADLESTPHTLLKLNCQKKKYRWKDKVVKKSPLFFYFINTETTTIKMLRIRITTYMY